VWANSELVLPALALDLTVRFGAISHSRKKPMRNSEAANLRRRLLSLVRPNEKRWAESLPLGFSWTKLKSK
jgi:hypothetical protein